MKVLKSHRDPYFLRWNQEDWAIWGRPSSLATFDYVSIEIMQRGDVTQESEPVSYTHLTLPTKA